MKHLLIIVAIGAIAPVFAQQPEAYKGPYLNGEAQYSYTTDEKNQRIFSGAFSYTEKREIGSRGESEIMVTGSYRENKKSGPWAVTIKSPEGVTETVTGQFINGQKIGLWAHRLSTDEGKVSIKDVSSGFNKNKFKGTFQYTYDQPEGDGTYKHVEVSGSFDQNGYYDGVWKIDYIDQNDIVFQDILKFKHGVFYARELKEMTNNQVMITENKNEAEVLGYFANMKPDSSGVFGDKKFGLTRTKTPFKHKMMLTALESFYKSESVVLGDHFGSAIPMMVIDHGEVKMSPSPTFELIDWEKTPKGREEMLKEQERIKKELEQKRIEEAFNAKVAEADQAVEVKKYEEAIELYKAAMEIKPDLYPQKQIPMVKEMIRVRDKKLELISSIREKQNALAAGQSTIMGNEDFNKKQKHLAAAYPIAYDYAFKQLKSEHSRVRTFLENENMDGLTIEDMEKYQMSLVEFKAFQDKIGSLVGTETKDLEKDLKKLEEPKEILARLKQD